MSDEQQGKILESLGYIRASVEALQNAEIRARAHRVALGKKLDTVVSDMSGLKSLRADVDEIKPLVKKHENLRQRGIAVYAGAMLLVAVFGSAFGEKITGWLFKS